LADILDYPEERHFNNRDEVLSRFMKRKGVALALLKEINSIFQDFKVKCPTMSEDEYETWEEIKAWRIIGEVSWLLLHTDADRLLLAQ